MEAVGLRLSALLHCEFAVATNGAAASICQAVCACLAGTDRQRMELLPDSSTFPRNEVP